MLPDGPEREQLFFEGKRLLSVYVPYKYHVHRILTDLTWPWVIGFRRPPYWRDWWPYVDIDAEQQAKAIRMTAARACRVALQRLLQSRLPSQPAPRSNAKVLRYAFPIAETGFDPAQITDLYSRIVTHHIFDGLYRYDHLARPFKIKPNTAAAMPEVSD